MLGQEYYCLDYDCVVKFEGYYDPLYGMVTIDKEHPCAPRTAYQMNVDCWKTRKEACAALLKDCEKNLVKAKARLAAAIVNTAGGPNDNFISSSRT
jgi:hypothetical protein